MPGKPEVLEFPMYIKGNMPSWPPGNGNSYIDLSRIEARIDCTSPPSILGGLSKDVNSKCTESNLDILFFEAPADTAWKDYWENHYCCNDEEIATAL